MSKPAQEENFLFQGDETYKRDLDIINNYITSHAQILHIETRKPLEDCIRYVSKVVAEHKIKDTQLRVLRRDKNGDRIKDVVGFKQYLDWVNRTGSILAPNMISYIHPDVQPSYSSKFIHMCINLRSEDKSKKKRYEQLGDKENAYFMQLSQANRKFFNNSASGAGSSEHNPLYYITKHTTLTSGCRVCTSSANSINEKLIASNRHYYSYEVTVDAIGYIIRNTDMDELQAIVDKYNIVIPTSDDVMRMVKDCTLSYWESPILMKRIETIVHAMSDIERCAFMYINDLNALCELSPNVVRGMFDEVIHGDGKTYSKEILSYGSEDVFSLTGMLCYNMMQELASRGLSIWDVEESEPEKWQTYLNTLGGAITALIKYSDFIRCMFITDVLPQNTFEVPEMVRVAVPASDTDSSIYTTDRIVEFYNGEIDFSSDSISAGALTAFLSATMIAHSMFKLSRQINVAEDQKYRIAMKGEFFFPVLLCTNLTKHYAYLTGACEGNVYAELELDTRGVGMKSSKLPPVIRAKSMQWYKKFMTNIVEGVRMTPRMMMAYPAYLEHTIDQSIKRGEITYFSNERINNMSVYKKPMGSNWQYADLWNNVFAKKYGALEEFPAITIKVPVKLANMTAIMAWVNTLEPTLATPMKEWLAKTGKRQFKNILLPHILLPGGQLPKEFIDIVDVRSLLNQNIAHCYIFATTAGIRKQNGHMLAFDDITYEESLAYMKQYGLTTLEEDAAKAEAA